ncbi:MAG: sensor histidine kinase [Thermomicrobiales bacterium]
MSIRLRLTLWYTAILFATLSAFAVVIYMGLERTWQTNLDTTVRGRAQEARAQITVLVSSQGIPVAAYAPEQKRLDGFTSDGIFIQYVDPNGTDRRHSSNLSASLVLSPTDIAAIKDGQAGYRDLKTATGQALRAYLLPVAIAPGDPPFAAVITAKSTAPVAATLRKAAVFLAGGVLAATLMLALIVSIVAKTALRPVGRMARDAAGIQQAQDLSRRVAVPRTGDEVADLGQTFNGMLGRLEAVFEAQRRFIADASHELRTPLTAIRGNADLLRYHGERMEREERAEVLDDMATEAERMSRLISDLLALARAQTGEQPQPAPVRFDEAVDGAVRAARGLARGHDIIYSPATGPFLVMGDPDRLKQLALILLDNAIKYTPTDGHIWAVVRQDRAAVELRVMDDGPGIPAERLPHLFERFYRGGTLARGRDDGGAGLGLAIAREIAQGYGGTIAVESTVGRGSAFIVQFPLLTPITPYHPADIPAAPVPTPIASQTETGY